MKLYLSSFRLGSNPERLVSLLSHNKKAAVVMNAIDDATDETRKEKLEQELVDLHTLGIIGKELDLRDYFGKKEELNKKLSEYGMVWVRGGNTFILRRAYAYSGFDEILKVKVSDKDFVYAGYSAGICVISPTLKTIELADDPHLTPHGYKSDILWEGLGLIEYAIAPHYRSDHPESEMIEKEVAYLIENKILFKALHDGEVIIEETNTL